jgi:hypothetical protein
MSGVPPEKGNKARLGLPNDHWTKENVEPMTTSRRLASCREEPRVGAVSYDRTHSGRRRTGNRPKLGASLGRTQKGSSFAIGYPCC